MTNKLFDSLRFDLLTFFGIDIDKLTDQQRGPGVWWGITNRHIYESNRINKWMMGMIQTRNVIDSLMPINDRVLFDTFPASQKWLKTIAEAIYRRNRLVILYQRYVNDEAMEYVIDPYYIKSFRNSLYVICKESNDMSSFSLDRIKDIAVSDEVFSFTDERAAEEFIERMARKRNHSWMYLFTAPKSN